jgi:biopolymer transport protein TolR
MAFISDNKPTQGTMAEINITPLVDVMLVLLIIFMVTAPFLQAGIDVDLPEAESSSAPTGKEDKIITIDRGGQIFLSGDDASAYTTQNLGAKLATLFTEGSSKTVYLKADKNVPYGAVVQVMAICKSAGIERIGMITQPEENREGG